MKKNNNRQIKNGTVNSRKTKNGNIKKKVGDGLFQVRSTPSLPSRLEICLLRDLTSTELNLKTKGKKHTIEHEII